MKATIYKDQAGEWRWRLTANNGEPIADSAEGYVEQRDARRGLRLVLSTTELSTEIDTIEPT